ncbi:imidazole glycerol phosphate synthase subunit HisF [Salidesulfovibrio onnuriiensis]|uniref:imidazole glycerol phosphate synthase subunit HisF n=1 Tax=Salidesulfovibrio onnuriiensis TaxID=2583823 RepID=UPI0011C77568|nr:imidazole glycerol phosphate synthase cyclase subunit [Salidesulfovibrio onnuriiensis]
MQLRRLIPALFIQNGLIVRSEDFSIHQIIGNVVNEAARYNQWNVDELIYVDISRHQKYDARRDDHRISSFSSIEEIIQGISKVCFMPLTFGGGIRKIEDVDVRIRNGADKVILNTGAYETPELVEAIASKYGNQCCVISADYRMVDGSPMLFTNMGTRNTGVNVLDWIRRCETMGAGEIFLHAIDRDGKANGYDFETINRACEATRLPVIACGGAATIEDFIDVFLDTPASAIAAGNMFHFTEHSYPRAKRELKREKINVR